MRCAAPVWLALRLWATSSPSGSPDQRLTERPEELLVSSLARRTQFTVLIAPPAGHAATPHSTAMGARPTELSSPPSPRLLPPRRRLGQLITPATILRWQRRLVTGAGPAKGCSGSRVRPRPGRGDCLANIAVLRAEPGCEWGVPPIACPRGRAVGSQVVHPHLSTRQGSPHVKIEEYAGYDATGLAQLIKAGRCICTRSA